MKTLSTSQRPNMSTWLKRDTTNVKRALEKGSAFFDKDDDLDVHTLEAVYAQESSFGQTRGKRGSKGPAGDFQIKKSTARSVGMTVTDKKDSRFDIDSASIGAAALLKRSDRYFAKKTKLDGEIVTTPINDSGERKKFALAAYNAGDARIAQAQDLARKAGRDPTNWNQVKEYLEAAGASERQTNETREYVEKILGYEKQFKEKSKANADAKYDGHWVTIRGRHVFIED